MKVFFLALAMVITPQLRAQVLKVEVVLVNFGRVVMVEIKNPEEDPILCSGSVIMGGALGGVESTPYFEFLAPGEFVGRSFYPRFNDQVVFAHHSITCRRN
jgi:hypothetical protein